MTDYAALPVFDRGPLLRQLGGDRALCAVILETFRDEWPERAKGVRRGLEQQDAELVARHAHTLKGSLRQLGADGAANRAEAVERAALRGDLGAAAEAWPPAERELERLDAQLSTQAAP